MSHLDFSPGTDTQGIAWRNSRKYDACMPVKSVEKIADRPHMWTLLLSVGAMVVSVASFWQSCATRRITVATSRASVQVASAKLLEAPETASFARYELVLTNFGKAAARNIRTRTTYDISTFPGVLSGDLSTVGDMRAPDMSPAMSQTIRLQAGARLSLDHEKLLRPKMLLVILGVTDYEDEATGLLAHDSWCFLYDPRDKHQKSTLELRRCES
jgi:hypothetical protein